MYKNTTVLIDIHPIDATTLGFTVSRTGFLTFDDLSLKLTVRNLFATPALIPILYTKKRKARQYDSITTIAYGITPITERRVLFELKYMCRHFLYLVGDMSCDIVGLLKVIVSTSKSLFPLILSS